MTGHGFNILNFHLVRI